MKLRSRMRLHGRGPLADAAKRPGKLNLGAIGAVGTPRIVMDEIGEAAKLQFNMVPFKGDADVTNAILGGHIDAAPLSGVAVPHIEAGKMRYLVMLTPQRVKRYPTLPTMKDAGIDAFIDSPYGIAGPAGMNPAQIQRVQDAFKKALGSPASHAREKGRVERLRQKGLLD